MIEKTELFCCCHDWITIFFMFKVLVYYWRSSLVNAMWSYKLICIFSWLFMNIKEGMSHHSNNQSTSPRYFKKFGCHSNSVSAPFLNYVLIN